MTEWMVQLKSLRVGLVPYVPLAVVVHLALLGVIGAAGMSVVLEPLRRTSRWVRRLLLGLAAVAFGVRGWVIPAMSRHLFDGHEADYYDVWRGVHVGPIVGYRASEPLRVLYQWVGPLFGGSGWWLLVISLLLSLASIPLAWMWIRDLTGDEQAGVWAAGILAFEPLLGFWASSAYNVQLPFLAGLAALALLERAIRRGSTAVLALAALCWAAAMAARPETALLVVPLGWRAVGHRRRLLPDIAGWAALALPIALATFYLVAGQRAPVGGDAATYVWQIFSRQVTMLELLDPWHRLPAVLSLALSAVLVWRKRTAGCQELLAFWFVFAASQYLAYAAFDDFGYRHTLYVRLCAAALAGTGLAVASGLPKWRWATVLGLGVGIVLPIAFKLQDVSVRYYATGPQFEAHDARFRSAPELDLARYRGCVFVAENQQFSKYAVASHFELFDSRKLTDLRAESDDCILFVYDLENFQASSRSIDARALKVKRFFRLELLGRVSDPDPGRRQHALVFRVHPR